MVLNAKGSFGASDARFRKPTSQFDGFFEILDHGIMFIFAKWLGPVKICRISGMLLLVTNLERTVYS